MADLPRLPPGFALDQPSSAATPPLPPGFKLDTPPEPMTAGRAAALTGRGVASGVSGLLFAPAEMNTLGKSVGNALASKIAGRPVEVPDMMDVLGPAALPYRALSALTQKYLGTESPTGALNEAATRAGVPAPQTAGQRFYVNTLAGLTGGALAGPAAGAKPIVSALSGAAAGAGQQGAAELGAGPIGQTAAGVAGALLPGGAKLAGQGIYRTLPGVTHEAAPRVTPPPEMPPENAVPVSLGLKIEPDKGGGIIGKVAESSTNPAITQRILSAHNAPTVNARVGEDLGVPTASPAGLEAAKKAPSAVYDQFRNLGPQDLDPSLHPSIEDFMAYSPRAKQRAQSWITDGQADSSELLDEIRQQRALGGGQLANRRANPEQGIIGKERLDFANQLEGQLDKNLTARQDLPAGFLDLFRGARQQFAKIYSAQEALRGDNIFVGDLAKQLDRGVPLSGNMRALAESYATHDRVLQDPGRIRSGGPITYGDYLMAGLAHLVNPAMWPAVVARPLVRAGLTSDLYQRYGIRGGSTPAAPSTQPAFQQLVEKYNAQRMPTQQGALDLPTPGPKPLQLTTPPGAPPLGRAPQTGAALLASKYGERPLPAPRMQATNVGPPAPLTDNGPLEPEPPKGFQYPDMSQDKPPSMTTGNAVTDKLRQYLENHHEEARARYNAYQDPTIGSTKGGRVMSVDIARELSPDYVANRTLSNDVHEPASEFIKRLYAERLAAPVAPDNQPLVLFTAGGTGAGKTSAIERVPEVKNIADTAHIIYDTNVAKTKSAETKIQQARAAGMNVTMASVYSDPAAAWQQALIRAQRIGRTVPWDVHLETHGGWAQAIQELRKLHESDPWYHDLSIDNSRGKGRAQLSPIDLPDGNRYTAPEEELKDVADQLYRAGKISGQVYQGAMGRPPAGGAGPANEPHPGPAGGSGGVQPPNRTGPGEQPQRERAGQAPVAQFEAPGASPSQHLLVARVGSSPSLVNRNAGTPAAVAMHLARLEDVERPQPAGVTAAGPQAVYVHEITPQEPFGAYQRGDRGEMQPGAIGRESGPHAVQYSFPEGSKYQGHLVTQIPIADLKAELKARTGTDSFDDLGGQEGGRVLGEILQDRIRAATVTGVPTTKPRVRVYPTVNSLDSLKRKYEP